VSDDRNIRQHDDVDASGSLVSGPQRRQLTTAHKLGVAALVLCLSLAFIWLGARAPSRREDKAAELSLTKNDTAFRSAPIILPPEPAPPPAPTTLPMPEKDAPSIVPAPVRKEPSPADSPIFAYAGEASAVKSVQDEERERGAAMSQDSVGDASETSLSAQLKPTILQARKATLLPHPDMLITQGTIIPCVLQTAIDTNLAGFVKCVLPQDIRGATGNVVLLDRGTVVVGEIQKGLQQGDGRVFVLWSRAETPGHAVVTLASPGSDELGRAGLAGKINNHFWKRFGGTILLSLIQGTFQAGTALASNSGGGGGGGTNVNSFQSNGEQAANIALRASIDIPPTLEKNQGDTVSIFVAQDLDFSSIYALRAVPPRSGTIGAALRGQP
jgi:type IV secretion system protein VirB10